MSHRVEDGSGVSGVRPSNLALCGFQGLNYGSAPTYATHFENGPMALLAEALKVECHIVGSHSGWTNGTVK